MLSEDLRASTTSIGGRIGPQRLEKFSCIRRRTLRGRRRRLTTPRARSSTPRPRPIPRCAEFRAKTSLSAGASPRDPTSRNPAPLLRAQNSRRLRPAAPGSGCHEELVPSLDAQRERHEDLVLLRGPRSLLAVAGRSESATETSCRLSLAAQRETRAASRSVRHKAPYKLRRRSCDGPGGAPSRRAATPQRGLAGSALRHGRPAQDGRRRRRAGAARGQRRKRPSAAAEAEAASSSCATPRQRRRRAEALPALAPACLELAIGDRHGANQRPRARAPYGAEVAGREPRRRPGARLGADLEPAWAQLLQRAGFETLRRGLGGAARVQLGSRRQRPAASAWRRRSYPPPTRRVWTGRSPRTGRSRVADPKARPSRSLKLVPPRHLLPFPMPPRPSSGDNGDEQSRRRSPHRRRRRPPLHARRDDAAAPSPSEDGSSRKLQLSPPTPRSRRPPCVDEAERHLSRALVATKTAEKHRAKREAKRAAAFSIPIDSRTRPFP